MPRTVSQYHRDLMAEFACAKQAWWAAAEHATMLYRTELAEYEQEHPQPRLQDHMRARAEQRRAVEAEAAREAVEAQERAARWAAEAAWLAELEAEWLAAESAGEDESALAFADDCWREAELRAALEVAGVAQLEVAGLGLERAGENCALLRVSTASRVPAKIVGGWARQRPRVCVRVGCARPRVCTASRLRAPKRVRPFACAPARAPARACVRRLRACSRPRAPDARERRVSVSCVAGRA